MSIQDDESQIRRHRTQYSDISVTCGPITLRPPTRDDVAALSGIVYRGLYAPDERPMVSWYQHANPVENAMNVARRLQASWQVTPVIHAQFTVVVDDHALGMQAVNQKGHPGTGSTGSWIAPTQRRRGHATYARWAALAIGFEVADVGWMTSRSEPANTASIRVSRNCSYEPIGTDTIIEHGQELVLLRYGMSRDRWRQLNRPAVHFQGRAELERLLRRKPA